MKINRWNRVGLVIVCLILNMNLVKAQNRFPKPGFLFDPTSIARVDIIIPEDSLDIILASGNEQSDHEFMATFKFSRNGFEETVDSVGFRLRGNTSRNSAKKSFKVSLNTFIPGQKFDGVEKINLNGEHNDPSISRAFLSWYIFSSCGVPASRSNHVQLYINDEYKGLYLNVEHIDEEFVNMRFGNNDGNLYKCLWPADLVYKGTDQESYKFENDGRRAYELKRNAEEDDYSDLVSFIDVLNNTDPPEFTDDLNLLFNVNTYLKNMAVEVLIGHWDAYSYNKNNYYLYHNEGTGKFEFIPYDPDNTFGISWFDDDFASRNIYNWSKSSEERPLMEKVLQNDVYNDRYSYYMNEFIKDVFNSDSLNPRVESLREQIASSVAGDVYRSMDYGYTYNDFYHSFEEAAGAHVRKGIIPFISERSKSALNQLKVNPIDPIITLLSIRNPKLSEPAQVRFLLEDDGDISDVKIRFIEGGDVTIGELEEVEEGLYISNYHPLQEGLELKFYMEAMDNEQNSTRDPLNGWYYIGDRISSQRSSKMLQDKTFVIYPNPAKSVLYSDSFIGHTGISYRIIDLSGRILQNDYLEEGVKGIRIKDGLINGMYILEIRISDLEGNYNVFTEKFSIER